MKILAVTNIAASAMLRTSLAIALLCRACAGHACDRPQFGAAARLAELAGSDFRIAWTPVDGARTYELKYVLRVPEGKTLAQQEATTAAPFFMLEQRHLRTHALFQLTVEVTAQCDDGRSETAHAQIALHNAGSACRFTNTLPKLAGRELSWLPIPSAQTYVLCLFGRDGQSACREADHGYQRIETGKYSLLSITPQCENTSGNPFFISLGGPQGNAPPEGR